MRLIRLVLLAAATMFAWRALRGRGRIVAQGALELARPESRGASNGGASRGTHSSAASAANEGFYDDRDVVVGEQLSAVGMRPGAR